MDQFATVFGAERGGSSEERRVAESERIEELRACRIELEGEITELTAKRDSLLAEIAHVGDEVTLKRAKARDETKELFTKEIEQAMAQEAPERDSYDYGRGFRETEEEKAERKRSKAFAAVIKRRLRRASPEEYKAWLRGYIKNGGRTTKMSSYLSDDNFYVATEDFITEPLYGSAALNILVPEGIRWHGGDLGHSHLYMMDGFTCEGDMPHVQVYKDTEP